MPLHLLNEAYARGPGRQTKEKHLARNHHEINSAADEQMVTQLAPHHDVHRTSNPMLSASQSRVFRLSPETQRLLPKKPRIAPPIGGGAASCD